MDSQLQFACPACRKRLRVAARAAGKTLQCPSCQKKLRIPPPKPSGPKATNANSPSSNFATASPSIADLKSAQKKATAPGKKPITPTPTSAASDATESPRPHTNPVSSEPFFNDTASVPEDIFGDLDITAAGSIASFPSPASKADVAARVVAGGPTLQKATPPGKKTKPKVDLRKAIESQIDGRLPKCRPTVGYRIGMMAIATLMILMPLAYVALVVGVALSLYHYTFDFFPGIFSRDGVRVRGRGMMVVIGIAITPIVAGAIVLIFMIKPIFVSLVGWEKPRTRSLTRQGEPLLFNLVDRICEAIGAPKPVRIDVDADVNASASFAGGPGAIIKKELVLTIGVPLVAGLSVRQFAGILAHEFGHFSQGAGMKAQWIIRVINGWFYKVVYLRDGLDEALDEAIQEAESAFVLILYVALFCVTIVRGILWCFMMVAHVASSVFSRQMEFDADRYQTALVGSQVFESTMREVHLLAIADAKAQEAMFGLIRKAIMIDDMPQMLTLCRRQLSQGEIAKTKKTEDESSTGIFDTHPAFRQRITTSQKWDSQPVLTIDRPARELIQHYDSLCKNVTLDLYRNAVGRMINPSELEPVERHMHAALAK